MFSLLHFHFGEGRQASWRRFSISFQDRTVFGIEERICKLLVANQNLFFELLSSHRLFN